MITIKWEIFIGANFCIAIPPGERFGKTLAMLAIYQCFVRSKFMQNLVQMCVLLFSHAECPYEISLVPRLLPAFNVCIIEKLGGAWG